MAYNRRSFIGLGSLAACGIAAGSTSLYAAAPRVLRGGLPLFSNDEAVLDYVRSYSSAVRIIGATVLGRIRSTGIRSLRILAEVDDLSALQTALIQTPFAGVYSNDNTISFTLGDVDVTIENLLPAVFAARIASLKKSALTSFAHDALAYDPATQQLSDPFDAAKSTSIRVVNKTLGGVDAFVEALRGVLEASETGLKLSDDFKKWQNRFLRQIVKNKSAQLVSEKFFQALVTLADKLPAAQFATLLQSKLVSTALQSVFGIEISAAIAQFQTLRGQLGGDVSDGAIWLRVLLALEIEGNETDGAATTWIQGGNRFQVLRSRSALKKAVQI